MDGERTGSDIGNLSRSPDRELLQRVGMLEDSGEVRRSMPLSDPRAFAELSTRLLCLVDVEYDCIVVRDMPGDRILGYQLSLLSGRPVVVSYDLEGMLVVDDERPAGLETQALLAADTHFTEHSMAGATTAVERTGAQVVGATLLIRKVQWKPSFPVWALEDFADSLRPR